MTTVIGHVMLLPIYAVASWATGAQCYAQTRSVSLGIMIGAMAGVLMVGNWALELARMWEESRRRAEFGRALEASKAYPNRWLR